MAARPGVGDQPGHLIGGQTLVRLDVPDALVGADVLGQVTGAVDRQPDLLQAGRDVVALDAVVVAAEDQRVAEGPRGLRTRWRDRYIDEPVNATTSARTMPLTALPVSVDRVDIRHSSPSGLFLGLTLTFVAPSDVAVVGVSRRGGGHPHRNASCRAARPGASAATAASLTHRRRRGCCGVRGCRMPTLSLRSSTGRPMSRLCGFPRYERGPDAPVLAASRAGSIGVRPSLRRPGGGTRVQAIPTTEFAKSTATSLCLRRPPGLCVTPTPVDG